MLNETKINLSFYTHFTGNQIVHKFVFFITIFFSIFMSPSLYAQCWLREGLILARGNSTEISTVMTDNGLYQLEYQPDGDLVISYLANGYAHPIWTTGTGGDSVRMVMFQSDGNLVMYDNDGAVWASGTNPKGIQLCFQDDGNLVVYGHYGQSVWSSGTIHSWKAYALGWYHDNSTPSRSISYNIRNESQEYCYKFWNVASYDDHNSNTGYGCNDGHMKYYDGFVKPGQSESIYVCSDGSFSGAYGQSDFTVHLYDTENSKCTAPEIGQVALHAKVPYGGDNGFVIDKSDMTGTYRLCHSSNMTSKDNENPYGIISFKESGC